MKKRIKELLLSENILLSSGCPLSLCKITRPYLLEREKISYGSVILFAIPYFSEDCLRKDRNISSYAVPEDYHAYTASLFLRLGETLKKDFPQNKFAFFSDRSPIDERDAAKRSGLGFIGKNGLLITEEYSSYFFIGEIITDASLQPDLPLEKTECEGCGKCLDACPQNADSSSECLSSVTQKKGVLSDFEISLMKKHGTLWGCDICQEVCPYTKRAIESGSIFTPIEFFKKKCEPILSYELIKRMSDEDFLRRAYSWRGKEVILRNISYFDNEKTEL